MKLGICLGLLTGLALFASTPGVWAAPKTTESSAALVREYVAALESAGTQITRVEARLKALPPTATPSQVDTIVRPVASKLTPLQRLLTTPPSSTAVTSTSRGATLESIGSPSISPGCGRYRTAALGAHLVVGNTLYKTGLQLTAPAPGLCSKRYVAYAWTLPKNQTIFTTTIALDSTDQFPSPGPIMSFVGNGGVFIPFKYHGKFVTQLQLTEGVKVPLSVDIVGESKLAIWLDPIEGGTSVVDIITDHIS